MKLGTFRCTAKDLHHEVLVGVPLWLRLDGDSDDPNTWHAVVVVHDHFGDIEMFTVEFSDGTGEKVLNATDEIEIAVLGPS